MTLLEYFSEHTKKCIDSQCEDGSFPAGHNGPYIDPEKPTRNTAHFLFSLSSVYEFENDPRVKKAAERAIGYLFSTDIRPGNASFHCRDKVNKDRCNGLIGQAWVIEALVKASTVFERSDCYELAEKVFLMHGWDEKLCLWHRLEIDGTKLEFDRTFNHQLWFAAAASLLVDTPDAKLRSTQFLNKVAAKVQLYPNGVIFHESSMGSAIDLIKYGMRPFLRRVREQLNKKSLMDKLYSKSVGYHGFNLYAYSILKERFPNEAIWESDLIHMMTSVTDDAGFLSELASSEYGYFYNLSGIEIAYAMEVLSEDDESAKEWLQRQFKYTFESPENPFSKNTKDHNTANARAYELARIKNDYEAPCV